MFELGDRQFFVQAFDKNSLHIWTCKIGLFDWCKRKKSNFYWIGWLLTGSYTNWRKHWANSAGLPYNHKSCKWWCEQNLCTVPKGILDQGSQEFLTGVQRTDGARTMHELQKLFAPMTHIDVEKTKPELKSLQMYKGELVTSFIQRFHAKLSAV